jgi:hypothetical protein
LKRLMEINPTYCLTIEIVPFRNSDLLVAYGSLIREVRQAASQLVTSEAPRRGKGLGPRRRVPYRKFGVKLFDSTFSLLI